MPLKKANQTTVCSHFSNQIHQIKIRKAPKIKQKLSGNAKECYSMACLNRIFAAFWNRFWKCQINSKMSVAFQIVTQGSDCTWSFSVSTMFLLDQLDSTGRTVHCLVSLQATGYICACFILLIHLAYFFSTERARKGGG